MGRDTRPRGETNMVPWIHLQRYAQAKKRDEIADVVVVSEHTVAYRGSLYDLRTARKGARFPGWFPTVDGRYFTWADSTLVVHHPDGQTVPIEGAQGLRLPQTIVVGRWLVSSFDARRPWVVIDTETGEHQGELEGQLPDTRYGTPLYSPVIMGKSSPTSLWLDEGPRLVRVDVPARRVDRIVEAPAGERYFGGAVAPDGRLAVIARPEVRGFDRSDDRLVLFSSDGKPTDEAKRAPIAAEFVGNELILADDRTKSFVRLDEHLREIESIAMFEPNKTGFVRILPLPSGRELIAIGGFGEWDHYGEVSLRPSPEEPHALDEKVAAKSRAASSKSASSKSAKSKAAKSKAAKSNVKG